MKGWKLVVLFCTALLCEPVRPQDKWSRPDQPSKRVDDWVPITASCPSCKKNLEPNEAGAGDEIGSLLNPPAAPSARAFNFNAKQNNFNRAPSGEPYEITTPAATSGQFFSQQQAPKIPQPVHFPAPFFGQQNPFQQRFQGLPSFQPQFTFIPQQPQPQPKENKIAFPESPFIQQQNKGSVQLVYVPIEALQRQKPRLQADRPLSQQTQSDIKSQSPFETGKLKFQRPPQPFEPPRFSSVPQFEQEPNRFAPPPPPPSFEQNTGRFPPPSQLFGQEKPAFSNQLKEQRPEFLPQNEQPVSPQSYQFVEDSRNPPSNFFQFHDNRFPKPSFEEEKPKDFKPQVQQSFAPNIDESRQESSQSFVSNFDGNRPRQGPPQQSAQQNFQETRPRQEPSPQNVQQNFQETRPRQELPPQNVQQNVQETRPRQEPRPQNGPPPSFQETRPRPESRPQNIQPHFQETRPRQEPPPQFVPKFEEPKLEPQQQFIPNFQETRPRPELPPPAQFVPNFEQPKLEPQPQFVPNFQETRPRQEPPPPQFVSKFEEPKLEPQQQFIPTFQELPQREVPQQQFTPNFESLRPRPESPQNFVPNFQETKPKQVAEESFVEVKPKSKPKVQSSPSSTPLPQQTFNNIASSTEQIVQTSTPYPPPHQPPLSVYMEKRLDNRINEVLTILKDAKTIPVLDTIGNRSPKVFVGPSDLDAPRGYVKFELPYLSSLDITKIDSMADRLPFFVAPLNFKPPFGYAKIPFPPPHIGSVVVSSKSQSVDSTTEFVPFALTSQLPTEVNSLQQAASSTTQRGTEKAPISSTTPATKRGRQRKPLHRGSLSSFSSTTPVNDITERQRDQFTTPAELQRLPEVSPSVSEQQQFIESTPAPARQKFSRKPVEQQTVAFETTQAPIQQQQQFDNPQPQQQQFDNSQQQQFFSDQQVPQTQQNFLDTLSQQQFFNNQQPSQQTFFENQPQPSQQPFFENQQPSQQPFFENQQQFLDNPPQAIQEQTLNNPQPSTEISNPEADQQQFISSSTEKQIFKNFQQIQPLSQYQVGNNFLNQQSSSTEQVQSASNPPQTVSNEPQTLATEASTETPKLRQRLSYYDKLLLSSTPVPVEITSAQNVETSEKPRERPKLRPRQRLTTTRKPTTESPASEDVSEHVAEVSTQRYNPLKRRRPSTTTTTEQTETTATRSSLRSRTTQAGRSEFVRSRSRRPLGTTTTSTTTTTTTTTTEAAPVQHYEDVNDVRSPTGQDEQRKIEEAASFWNEPVTIQQSHSYELDTRYTQAPSTGDGKYSSGEPPADEDLSKEKYGNDKKAHDPNNEKKGPGRRGHWVRVRVKKPQDNLDTAESQNSLGPLSANAVRELATKPTTEFSGPVQFSSSEPATEATTLTAATSAETAAPITATTTTTTTASPPPPPPSTTVLQDYVTEAVTEERPAETTVAPSPSAPSKYPDDEQDEAFQRNLADMLAKFISGNGEQQQQQQPQQQQQQQQQQETTAAAVADETTAETMYADAELTTVTTPAVTELPSTAPVTSTTTKVSMETEICYKGRCVKSKKNKQITDLMPEP